MARIRSVKPEFWTDPDVVELSVYARLLFIGSWNHADDYGVLRDDPRRLKLQVLPADDVDAEELTDELVNAGLLLRRVTSDGTKVLVIRTFCVHQKIDKRAVGRWGHPDDFHPPPENPHQSPPIPTDSTPGLEGTGLEGTGRDGSSNHLVEPASPPSTSLVLVADEVTERPDPVQVVFDAWRAATDHPRAKLDADRRKRIKNWLRTYSADDLADACRGITFSDFHMGRNDRSTKYDGIEHALKSAHHIEQFRDWWREGGPAVNAPEAKGMAGLRAWAQGGER